MAEQILAQTQEQRMQQIMAPQMRQSLEILQLPALELRSLIQQEMEKNPALEEQAAEQEAIEEPKETAVKEDEELQGTYEGLPHLRSHNLLHPLFLSLGEYLFSHTISLSSLDPY